MTIDKSVSVLTHFCGCWIAMVDDDGEGRSRSGLAGITSVIFCALNCSLRFLIGLNLKACFSWIYHFLFCLQ